MPRGNAVNLIPWPYRWLAVAALAVALIGFGWVKGAGHVQSKWDAAAQQQTLQAAAIRERQAQATVKVVTQYVDRVRVVNRPGFPRRLGASGSDAAQTLQAAGRQHWNDDVWGYRTFRCS